VNKIITLIIVFFISGCGYTVGGFKYEGRKIVIVPVENKIDITSESRKYSGYITYPVLIEDDLTNAIIRKFNIDGHLTVVRRDPQALRLSCIIKQYKKETLRWTDADDPEKQRLRLYVKMTLTSPEGEILHERNVMGENEYFLSGRSEASEEAARIDLVNDISRRIVEAVVEEW